MSKFAEYNPLGQIVFRNNVSLAPKGLVVVVGPNSSGKTRFLKDVGSYLLGGNLTSFVVCKSITGQPPKDPATFFNDLVQLKYAVPAQGASYRMNLPRVDLAGGGGHDYSFDLQLLIRAIPSITDNRSRGPNDPHFFMLVGRALVAYLSMDVRIKTTDPVTRQPNMAQMPLTVLQSSGSAQRRLSEETGRVFGNAAFLEQTDAGRLILRVCGGPKAPENWEINDAEWVKTKREITDEGDGYRSHVGTCIPLLLKSYPVTLIDEPELCLHPPQAYEIGKFIGRNAVWPDHVTFVATHSSHVLRGIMETADSPRILRLTREKTDFSDHDFVAHYVDNQELDRVLSHPRARAEEILDGMFSQAACLVEGDGDRVEYQAALDDVGETYKKTQIHFVPVDGTGGFSSPARFYQQLQTPFAVIADLDFGLDTGVVGPILENLNADPVISKEILDIIPKLVGELNKVEPSVKEEEVTKKLEEISARDLRWENRDDVAIKKELEQLIEKLKRRRRLKEGGIEAYKNHSAAYCLLKQLVEKCKALGLFLVPVGELEGWVPHLMGEVRESRKPERALIAAKKIKESPDKNGDIWDFMKSVLTFLTGPS